MGSGARAWRWRRGPHTCSPASARWAWEHSISPGEWLRFSITYRTLSDKGRRIATQQDSSNSLELFASLAKS